MTVERRELITINPLNKRSGLGVVLFFFFLRDVVAAGVLGMNGAQTMCVGDLEQCNLHVILVSLITSAGPVKLL